MYFNPLDPVDIGEKINLLIRDNLFYQELQKKSLQRSILYSWDKTAEETLEIYKSAI